MDMGVNARVACHVLHNKTEHETRRKQHNTYTHLQ